MLGILSVLPTATGQIDTDKLKAIVVLLVLSSFIFMHFDRSHFNGLTEKDDTSLLNRWISRLYFVTTTFSTVGYGDITPKSRTVRLLTIVLMIGILVEFLNPLQDSIMGMRVLVPGAKAAA